MSTKTKERKSKETYRQCVMKPALKPDGPVAEYVAWIPSKFVQIGKRIIIDSMPMSGGWLIVSAGDPRPAYIVEAYAENARKGFASVTGHEEHKGGS